MSLIEINYFKDIIYLGNWFTTMKVYMRVYMYTCKCTTQQRIKD